MVLFELSQYADHPLAVRRGDLAVAAASTGVVQFGAGVENLIDGLRGRSIQLRRRADGGGIDAHGGASGGQGRLDLRDARGGVEEFNVSQTSLAQPPPGFLFFLAQCGLLAGRLVGPAAQTKSRSRKEEQAGRALRVA